MSEPRMNKYTCNVCHGAILTIDVDEGVTPFSLRCYATPGCKGTSYSSFYRVSDLEKRIGQPKFEWFKPSAEEYKKLSGAFKDHVDQGGLDLRDAETKELIRS